MAFDPNDPRRFTLCLSESSRKVQAQQSSSGYNALSVLRRIADLEVDTRLFDGFRTLSKISDGVSETLGYDPFNGDGITEVLGNLGISRNVVEQIGNFNPNMVNQASTQAKQIADKVRAGNFSLEEVPGVLQDFRNLQKLIGSTQLRKNLPGGPCVDYPSPYAVDFDYFFPKYKFLFAVQFTAEDGYEGLLSGDYAKQPAFLIHQFERPTVTFEHEDVNMYNFRTKVLKHATYEPVTFNVHDDTKNKSFELFTNYIKAISPIANLENGTLLELQSLDFDRLHGDGKLFTSELGQHAADDAIRALASNYSSSINPLVGNRKTIFKEITLYHFYDWGRLMDVYHFFNPKIMQIQLDEVNMAESGTGNNIQVQFAYDSVYFETGHPVDQSITEMTSVGLNPIRNTSGSNNSIASMIPGIPTRRLAEVALDEIPQYKNDLENTIAKAGGIIN